jgi:hypothetical protein
MTKSQSICLVAALAGALAVGMFMGSAGGEARARHKQDEEKEQERLTEANSHIPERFGNYEVTGAGSNVFRWSKDSGKTWVMTHGGWVPVRELRLFEDIGATPTERK